MRIPDSISSMVYQMKQPLWWSLGVYLAATVGLLLMTDGMQGRGTLPDVLAFAACSCLLLVGGVPLLPGSHNRLHYVLAIVACVASQLWCMVVGDVDWVIIAWCSYVLLWPLWSRWWCLVAEGLAVAMVLATALL